MAAIVRTTTDTLHDTDTVTVAMAYRRVAGGTLPQTVTFGGPPIVIPPPDESDYLDDFGVPYVDELGVPYLVGD